MNKNNTHNNNSFQLNTSKHKPKDAQGRSQFTRNKLQRDYQPKLNSFKHKLHKPHQHQKLSLKRYELQKQQQTLVLNAIQCFKKGQFIDLDWKTKSNFRKSQMSVRFPKINTQPLQLQQQNKQLIKSNIFNNQINNYSKTTKNKSIQEKQIKLKQLLYPKCISPKLSKKYFRNQQNLSISKIDQSVKLINQQMKSSTSKNKSNKLNQSDNNILNNKSQNNILNNKSDDGVTEDLLNQFVSQQKIINIKNHSLNNVSIDFIMQRSQTQDLQNVKIFQQLNPKSQRDNTLRLKSSSLPRQLQSPIQTQNQHISLKQINEQKNTISQNNLQSITNSNSKPSQIPHNNPTNQQKKQVIKTQQGGYDILNDPQMYLLISKSRQKIISWKQNFAYESLSTIEKLHFLQQKSSQNNKQKQRKRSMSLQQGLVNRKVSKEKILQKIEIKKKQNSQKLQKKYQSRIFTQTQQFLKNQSSINETNNSRLLSYLNMSMSQNKQKNSLILQNNRSIILSNKKSLSSKIKQRKKQSLIEVQQKLLNKVKLSFLKQDLTKKFQQIRNQKLTENPL